MPRLSVIMPVYNTAKFLARSIESVLAQTFTDFELILVNDGSKDNSLEICREFEKKDKRIKVIDKENGGAGSARNAGLAASSGEFVAFPDSDDWIEPDAYEFCIDKMSRENLDLLVFGSLNTVYDGDEVLSVTKGSAGDFSVTTKEECRSRWAEFVRNYPMDGPSNKMYRGEIARRDDVTFPDIRRMQDGVFNMRYYDKISSVGFVDKYFYHFTQHPSDFQRKKMPAAFLDCAITYHKTAIDMLRSWGLKTKESEILLGEWFSETVEVAALEYLPADKPGFSGVRAHIKSICKNSYVHDFYVGYSKLTKLSKKEKAFLHAWSLPLAYLAAKRNRK